jgi:hypothetical protein
VILCHLDHDCFVVYWVTDSVLCVLIVGLKIDTVMRIVFVVVLDLGTCVGAEFDSS